MQEMLELFFIPAKREKKCSSLTVARTQCIWWSIRINFPPSTYLNHSFLDDLRLVPTNLLPRVLLNQKIDTGLCLTETNKVEVSTFLRIRKSNLKVLWHFKSLAHKINVVEKQSSCDLIAYYEHFRLTKHAKIELLNSPSFVHNKL